MKRMRALNVIIRKLTFVVPVASILLPLVIILYNEAFKSISEIVDRSRNYSVIFFETTILGSKKIAQTAVTNLEHKPDGMTCFHHLTENKKICMKSPILVVTPLDLQ